MLHTIALYVMSTVFAFMAVLGLFGGLLWTAALFLVLAVYFLPPLRMKIGFEPSKGLTGGVAVASFILMVMAASTDLDRLDDREAAERAVEEEVLRLAAEDSLRAVFEAEGEELILRAGAEVEENRLGAARAMLEPYGFLDDPQVRGLTEEIAAIQAEEMARLRAERATEAERREQERIARTQAALARLSQEEDRVEGVTWYRHPDAPRYVNSRSAVYLYMGRRGEGPPSLRFVVQYVATDWLFVERLTFNVDGRQFVLNPGHFAFNRDNSARQIWEWWNTPAQGEPLRVARALAESSEAILRYQGQQYRRDRTITAAEKRAIRHMLEAYDLLEGR